MKKPGTLAMVLGHLWMLPHTLIGLFLILVYVPTSIRWKDGRLEVVPLWILGSPGAQTHGNIVFFCHKNAREDKGLVVHECCHIVQAMTYGPFYLLSYPAEAVMNFIDCPDEPEGQPRWFRAYWAIGWEKAARRKQNQYLSRELAYTPWGG